MPSELRLQLLREHTETAMLEVKSSIGSVHMASHKACLVRLDQFIFPALGLWGVFLNSFESLRSPWVMFGGKIWAASLFALRITLECLSRFTVSPYFCHLRGICLEHLGKFHHVSSRQLKHASLNSCKQNVFLTGKSWPRSQPRFTKSLCSMCFSNPILSYFYLQVRQGGKFSTVGLTFHSVVDFLCLGQRAARKERTCVHFLISKLKLELLERNTIPWDINRGNQRIWTLQYAKIWVLNFCDFGMVVMDLQRHFFLRVFAWKFASCEYRERQAGVETQLPPQVSIQHDSAWLSVDLTSQKGAGW